MLSNRQHLGYATLFSPDGFKESDTFTCAHCNAIVHVPPKPHPMTGGTCALCGYKLICSKCEAKGNCDPLEKKLLRIEASDRFRRQAGLNG